MGGLATQDVLRFLEALGKVYEKHAALYLIGGGALCLLGSPRRTMDIDFSLPISDETRNLIETMVALADEMKIELEVITLEEFIPTPSDAAQRHRYVGRFGAIDVYIYDPYTIALSKLARGLESDIQDVLFLLQNDVIEMEKLTRIVAQAIPAAWSRDVDPEDLQRYLAEVQRLFYQ